MPMKVTRSDPNTQSGKDVFLYPLLDANNVVVEFVESANTIDWAAYQADKTKGPDINAENIDLGYTWNPSTQIYEPPAVENTELQELINKERDRRIDAGVIYDFTAATGGALGEIEFQTNLASRENIAGAATFSFMAVVQGANTTNLRWARPDSDFAWISADNIAVPMSAPLCLDFCTKAMTYKSQLIFAARILKDSDPIPQNYHDDSYWPDKIINN